MNDDRNSLLPVGHEIDFNGSRLLVEKRLSSGLTGEVYRGRLTVDGSMQTTVAIKAMKALEFPAAKQLFRQEALTLAHMDRLEKEAGKDDGIDLKVAPKFYGSVLGDGVDVPYIVMEYIHGDEIPDLLGKHDRLPELQALTAGWHLFRTLHIMHSELQKSYIDLKFENLWWVGSDHDGQLKLTDFGTLEDIKSQTDPGVKRDLLLGGVYLCAMLTGYTLDYSIGDLRQLAAPIIEEADISWGASRLLHKLLHRNPKARFNRAADVSLMLKNLVRLWQADNSALVSMALSSLDKAEAQPETDEGRIQGREYAERARSALAIAALRSGDEKIINPNIERADTILEQSSYLNRGQALFEGGSYELAHNVFREGIHWSVGFSDPSELRRWSYLAHIGMEVPSRHFDEAARKKAINAVQHMQDWHWERALDNLRLLEPDLESDGLRHLQAECRLFNFVDSATRSHDTDNYDETVSAYEQALAQLGRLPAEDQEVITEEIGDLQSKIDAYKILQETRGRSLKLLDEATQLLNEGQVEQAVDQARRAFNLQPFAVWKNELDQLEESDKAGRPPARRQLEPAGGAGLLKAGDEHLHLKLDSLAADAMKAGHYEAAGNILAIALRAPGHFPHKKLTQRWHLARAYYLMDAAVEAREKQLFTQHFHVAAEIAPEDPPLEQFLIKAARVAYKARDSLFLRTSAELAQATSANDMARRINEKVEELEEARDQERRQQVEEQLRRAQWLLDFDKLEDPRHTNTYFADWTLTRFLYYLDNRRAPLEVARKLVQEALTVAERAGDDDIRRRAAELKDIIDNRLQALAETETAYQQRLDQQRKTTRQQIADLSRQLSSAVDRASQASGEERQEMLEQTRQIAAELAQLTFVYLSQVQADDEEVLALRDEALSHLNRGGRAQWQALRQEAAGRIATIEEEFAGARILFEQGDIEKAAHNMQQLARTYQGSDEWLELETQIKAAHQWRAWQQRHSHKLESGQYDAGLLRKLRAQVSEYSLPGAYWNGSAAAGYVAQVRSAAEQETRINIASSQRAYFVNNIRQWFDAEMTSRLAPSSPTPAESAPQAWNGRQFLTRVYQAAAHSDVPGIEKRIEETPLPSDVDAALQTMTEDDWRLVRQEYKHKRAPTLFGDPRLRLAFFAGATVIILLLVAGIAYLLAGDGNGIAGLFGGDPTATTEPAAATVTTVAVAPTITPTVTLQPTATPTNTPIPTNTPTVTPTSTPLPVTVDASAYFVQNSAALAPAPPLSAEANWLLPLSAAAVQPGLQDAAAWNQVEVEGFGPISHTITVTQPVSVTWRMDQPLNDGVYELHVLDSLVQSAGAHQFTVALNGQPVDAWRGHSNVIFNDGAQGQQSNDWLSLGVYQVTQGQMLEVSVVVQPGSPPFAAPYLLLSKLSSPQTNLLEFLPDHRQQGRMLYYLADDQLATFLAPGPAQQTFEPLNPDQIASGSQRLAWNGSFRYRSFTPATDLDAVVEWAPLGRLPAGQYELRAWIPAVNSTAVVQYQLFADGEEVPRANAAEIRQSEHGNEWYTLGTWQLPEEAAVSVRLVATRERYQTLFSDLTDLSDHIGADAVVLLRVAD